MIERVRPGVYRAALPPETTDQTLFEGCAAVPLGVICMTSALAYHRLSTINPSQIEMAVPRDHRKPVVAYPPIRFDEFCDMTTGLERVRRRGAELRIFNAERSIADAFRLRHEIGNDVALEALQTYLRRRSGRRVETLLSVARPHRSVQRHPAVCRSARVTKNSDEIKNVEASVRARLANVAKAQGADFGFILRLYFLERFLYRLGASRSRDSFLLKSALLFFARADEDTRPFTRPTRDIDLEALAMEPNFDELKRVFQVVARVCIA